MKNLTDFRKTLEAGVDPRLWVLTELSCISPIQTISKLSTLRKFMRHLFTSFVVQLAK